MPAPKIANAQYVKVTENGYSVSVAHFVRLFCFIFLCLFVCLLLFKFFSLKLLIKSIY